MKTRCRRLLQSIALFLGVALLVSPAAFGATGSVSGADEVAKLSVLNVEDKVDCTLSYLRVEKEMEVPDDFKSATGFMAEVEAKADAEGLIPMDTPDPNLAANSVIKDVCNTLLARTVTYQNILVAILDNVDNVSADYCEMWEAFEEAQEPTVQAQDEQYDPVIPDDPDPDPDEPEDSGWIYYGKEYDLEEIADRADQRSTNGVLYFSDGDFVNRESESFTETGNSGTCITDIPPMILPYLVIDNSPFHSEYNGGGDGSYENTVTGDDVFPDVFDTPTVQKTDLYYRYRWDVTIDEMDVAGNSIAQVRETPTPSFSAALYDNNWIAFEYNGDMAMLDDYIRWTEEYGYYASFIVGLHPGGREEEIWDYNYSEESGEEIYAYYGLDNHPGAGSPRFDFYEDRFNMSEDGTGRPLNDFYIDGELAWLPITQEFYGYGGYFYDTYDGFSSTGSDNYFDLADSFVLFRPYQAVADLVESEEPPDTEPISELMFQRERILLESDFTFSIEPTDHKYTVTTGNRHMVAHMDSVDQAIASLMEDEELLARVDDFYLRYNEEKLVPTANGSNITNVVSYGEIIKHGEFKPGWFRYGYGGWIEESESYDYWSSQYSWDYSITDSDLRWNELQDEEGNWLNPIYEFGLQTVGQEGFDSWSKALFMDSDSLDRLNENGFLAYAVQFEEDVVNRKILDLATQHEKWSVADSLRDAQATAGIRERDAWYAQNADAQSGRVTKDQHGNWVRSQQYVLRSEDDQTVQVVNATLRGDSNLSTMVFETNFNDAYSGDLTQLPWGMWLGTLDDPEFFPPGTYVETDAGSPELADMSVKFTNPASESLEEARTFGGKESVSPFVEEVAVSQPLPELWAQGITGEQLTLVSEDNGTETYGYDASGTVPNGLYETVAYESGGFYYAFNDGREDIEVSFYEAYDKGEGPAYESGETYKDIWDALRVNLSGGPQIENRNLEITIDEAGSFFSQPIDVIYIPMSRMLWKDVGSDNDA